MAEAASKVKAPAEYKPEPVKVVSFTRPKRDFVSAYPLPTLEVGEGFFVPSMNPDGTKFDEMKLRKEVFRANGFYSTPVYDDHGTAVLEEVQIKGPQYQNDKPLIGSDGKPVIATSTAWVPYSLYWRYFSVTPILKGAVLVDGGDPAPEDGFLVIREI